MDRISPLWLGLGVAGALIIILLLSETLLGRWNVILAGGDFDPLARVSGGELRDFRIAVVHCLQAGYLPAALLYVLRSGRRTILDLQDIMVCSPGESRSLVASLRLSRPVIVILAFLGLLFVAVSPYLIPPVPLSPWNPTTWSPEVVWHRVLGPVTNVLSFWLAYAVVMVSLRMSHIAKELVQVDLLDLPPLSPFTQLGLTNALLLVGSLSIWSLMMIETGFGQMLIFIGGMTLISTAIALLLPVYGVHKRIRQRKEIELAWVKRNISQQRGLLQKQENSRSAGGLADLISYQGLIESVPEWPFTRSTYTRIVLYVLLPVVTWGFGLLAEEVIGRALF